MSEPKFPLAVNIAACAAKVRLGPGDIQMLREHLRRLLVQEHDALVDCPESVVRLMVIVAGDTAGLTNLLSEDDLILAMRFFLLGALSHDAYLHEDAR